MSSTATTSTTTQELSGHRHGRTLTRVIRLVVYRPPVEAFDLAEAERTCLRSSSPRRIDDYRHTQVDGTDRTAGARSVKAGQIPGSFVEAGL
jgi:hypothetical protein